jgi:hypothetical protein
VTRRELTAFKFGEHDRNDDKSTKVTSQTEASYASIDNEEEDIENLHSWSLRVRNTFLEPMKIQRNKRRCKTTPGRYTEKFGEEQSVLLGEFPTGQPRMCVHNACRDSDSICDESIMHTALREKACNFLHCEAIGGNVCEENRNGHWTPSGMCTTPQSALLAASKGKDRWEKTLVISAGRAPCPEEKFFPEKDLIGIRSNVLS